MTETKVCTVALAGIYRFTLWIKNGQIFSTPDRGAVKAEGSGKHDPLARFSMQDADTGTSTAYLGVPLVVTVNSERGTGFNFTRVLIQLLAVSVHGALGWCSSIQGESL